MAFSQGFHYNNYGLKKDFLKNKYKKIKEEIGKQTHKG